MVESSMEAPHTCEVCDAPCGIAVRDFAGPQEHWEPAIAEHWLCREHLRLSRFECQQPKSES